MPERQMNTVQYLAPGELGMRRVAIPRAGEGELVVQVRAATTCGTDVKTYLRGHPKFQPPSPFGHEFAGDVVQVGAGVTRFSEGMRVTANVFAPCGTCFFCKMGQGNLCESMVYNLGAYAEYLLIPAPIVRLNTFELPADIPVRTGRRPRTAGIGRPRARAAAIQPGESVLILGAGGPIGLMHLQMALLSGAAEVIAVDRSATRLKIASLIGASPPPRARPAPDRERAHTN